MQVTEQILPITYKGQNYTLLIEDDYMIVYRGEINKIADCFWEEETGIVFVSIFNEDETVTELEKPEFYLSSKRSVAEKIIDLAGG